MRMDDWDLPDDGEVNSDPEDITLKPKIMPTFSKKIKKKSPPPFNSFFECTYPSNDWEIINIKPAVGKIPPHVRYELVKDGKYFKLQVIVGNEVQCYWLCTETEPGTFNAWYYECERVIYGSRFFNPFTGENDDGIFGPRVYGDIVFGHKWEFVVPRFKQHIHML